MSNAAPPPDGVVVLDFTHALAGPYCAMLMATYGVNVVEVEEPEQGDISRTWGPPSRRVLDRGALASRRSPHAGPQFHSTAVLRDLLGAGACAGAGAVK